MKRNIKKSLLSLALVAALAPAAYAQVAPAPGKGAGHDIDNRPSVDLVSSLAIANPAQARALGALQSRVRDLRYEIDAATGATTTLNNMVGHLTEAKPGDTKEIALAFIRENTDLLGLTSGDVSDFVIASDIVSPASSVRHIYLQQTYQGLPVYNAYLHININNDGRILSVNNGFVPNLRASFNRNTPAISAEQAVIAAADFMGIDAGVIFPSLVGKPGGVQQITQIDASGLAQPFKAQLMLLPVAGEARLVWNFTFQEKPQYGMVPDVAEFNVDAETGHVWTKFSGVEFAQYQVFAKNTGLPIESPVHSTPAAPADGRVILTDPWIFSPAPAVWPSPYGWHDTNGVAGAESTLSQGNNAISYLDADNDSNPEPGEQPDGGAGLSFIYPIDLATQAPSAYVNAAVTNQFYMVNVMHDIFYQYGFNETYGNYQVNNYGRGGTGNDPVRGEAQDGSGTNNANFYPSADGVAGKMQMYIWTAPNPDRDGDFDNGVIAHEYGHGISNRLVGPLNSSSCLNNSQQPGEGLSDWWALFLTHDPDFTGYPLNNQRIRGMGPYVTNSGADGPGIRTDYYDGDPAVNPQPYENLWTYASLAGSAIPHGVGEKWTQAYWEVTWALIDEHGYDKNLYNYTGTSADAGNIRAQKYIVEGLRNTQCSPAFTHVRDGIIQAAASSYGGEDVCLLWQAFANFGLGSNAVGSPSTITPTNGFEMPASCMFLDASPSTVSVCAGNDATFPITLGQAFEAPVSMAVSGVPSPATFNFSTNPVTTIPGSTTLTISNTGSVAAGSYSLTVTGTDSVGPQTLPLTLNVASGIPAAPGLTLPANGGTEIAVTPTFTWAAVSGAESYVLEVSTSPSFSTIAYTATVTGTSHVPTTSLSGATQYYWRVRSQSACGSTNSAVFSFTTVELYCATTVMAIPDSSSTGVTSTITIPNGGTITDLDIEIKTTHSWPGDLIYTLTNTTTGTSAVIYDRPGVPASTYGCSTANVDVVLDDEGTSPVETTCNATPPGIGGRRIPNNPLSVFDGQDRAGTWTLKVTDNAAGDTGSLTGWCVQATVGGGGGGTPIADVQPLSIEIDTVQAGGSASETLTIANVGDGLLTWSIDEATTGKAAAKPAASKALAPTGPAERQSVRIPLFEPRPPYVRDYDAYPLVDVITDGGFEMFSGWDESSSNFGTILCDVDNCGLGNGNGPHGGVIWAWFGGISAVETGYAHQTVTIPEGTAATLSYWFATPSVSGLASDFFKVSIDSTELLSVPGTVAQNPAWTQVTLDVSAFADGNPHTVKFDSTVGPGGSAAMNYFLDDVVLDVTTGGGPGPEPSACENAADIPWLTVSPTSGSAGAGASSTSTITANPGSMAAGTYNAVLCVNTNDPLQQVINVPVSMTIAPLSGPIFSDGFEGEPAPEPFYYERFDSYPLGSIQGQGGWKGWGNDSSAAGLVSNAQSVSPSNSLNVSLNSDTVREFTGLDNGKWKLTGKLFIPTGFSGESYFIALGGYSDTCHLSSPMVCGWAVQVSFSNGFVTNEGNSGGELSYTTNQWNDVELIVDFDNDTQTFKFNGQELYTGSWTAEQTDGSPLSLNALDLFSNGGTTVYWDDIKIVEITD